MIDENEPKNLKFLYNFLKKMRNPLPFFLLIFLNIGCEEKIIQPPVSEEKLVRIVADLYSIEGVLQGATKQEKDSIAPVWQAQVFDNQQVTKEQYLESIEILSKNPEKLDSIFTRAARLLSN
jgi:hypothetical protein